ncbi:MAG: D-alanyl-D-alanine carboxypeptidase family protein [Hyphomicrobiales bacterium]
MGTRQAARSHEGDEADDALKARWRPWFIASILAVAASVLVFVVVLVGLATGGDDGGGDITLPGADDTRDARPTQTTQPGQADTATQPANGETGTAPASTPQPEGKLLTCGDIMAPLNKLNYLGEDCEPDDLEPVPSAMSKNGTQLMRADARAAFIELVNGAAADGYALYAVSAYRSYQGQVEAYQSNLDQCGGDTACADRVSAHPGHSEHQLGTTVDVSSPTAGFGLESFIGTPEADWLRDNAWRYGFVVSYPEGTEQITGYAFEPWHIRWIGREEAKKVHDSGHTLHEYLAGHG